MKCASNALFLALSLTMNVTSAYAALPRTGGAAASVVSTVNAGQLDFSEAARLHRRAALAGDLESAYARLDAASAASVSERSKALRTKAVMKWWDGDVPSAMATLDAALEIEESLDAVLLKGRLLDIQGQAGDAAVWYEKARADAKDTPTRAFLDLRLAMIDATGQRLEGLADFARSQGDEASGRAPSIFALLGYPAAAIALHQKRGGSWPSYVDQIRLADWAIAAGDSGGAADFARGALLSAHNSGDQRYALALLTEAFRAADNLAGAAAFLATLPSNPEIDQARLDLLLELHRYDEAIALVDRSDKDEMRQRLPEVLKTAGRKAEAEAEYRRLIDAHPNKTQWDDDLAILYLEQGRRSEAADVYTRHFQTGQNHVDVLIGAAQRMIAMGLGEEARRRLEKIAEDPSLAVPVMQFLVGEALDHGRSDEAETLLADLQRLRPSDAPLLIEVSDDYERLGRKDQALDVLARLEAKGQTLDYDQQLHMADLAFSIGRPEEALARWRRLWNQSETPARKSYLQRQIIKGAARLRQLDEIAADLERRIAVGTSVRDDLDLLVEIRISQQDDVQAQSAVERYVASRGMSETERLEQLAAIHARLRQYPALTEDLSRLAEVDPKNADFYLRRLIVNTLRYPVEAKDEAARTRTVVDLLARLRESIGHADVENARFAATTYAAIGMTDKAVEQYRQVMALAPADLDGLIELTSLLGRLGRGREAVALLQYEIESTNDPALLSTAISGLLDVLSADPDTSNEQGVPADLVQASLAWAKRVVLERMIRDGDVRLPSLLGDIAQECGDFELQLRALGFSLPTAGDQRAAALRQLIALTSPRNPGASNTIRSLKQKAIFERRLIALKHPFPPKVYADVARDLLEEGDLAGAERAFALMGDVDGLVNPDTLKGDAYAQSGHPDLAMAAYKMARLRGQDNSDPVVDDAILLEQVGEGKEATENIHAPND